MREDAVELFGGRSSLASQLVGGLGLKNIVHAEDDSDDGASAVAILSRVRRQDLLDCFNGANRALDRVMPLEWADGEKEFWRKRMNENGEPVMVAEGGVAADEDVALELFVRMEALKTLCMPRSASTSTSKNTSELKSKYQEMLSSFPE